MRTRRILLGLGAFVLSFSLAATAAPLGAAILSPCRDGYAYGSWELPSGGHDGWMSGKLVDSATNTGAYEVKATLVDVPSPCLSCIQGTIEGTLDDGFGPSPDYYVKGEYSGVWSSGSGTFWVYIYKPTGAAPVGKISGHFSDPPGSTTVGAFRGEWEICD